MFFRLYLGRAATIFCFLRLPPARSSGLSVTRGCWFVAAFCRMWDFIKVPAWGRAWNILLISYSWRHSFWDERRPLRGRRKKDLRVQLLLTFFFLYCAQSERELAWAMFEGWPQHKASSWGPPSERLALSIFFSVPTAVKLHTCTDFRERIACGFFHAAFVSVSCFPPREHCDHLERARQAVWIRTERFASDIQKESSAVAGGGRNKNVYCMNQ